MSSSHSKESLGDFSSGQLDRYRQIAALLLLDSNLSGSRRNPVCYDFNPARTGFHGSWNIDHGGHDCVTGGDSHRTMVVSASIKDMPRSYVGNAHQRVIGGAQCVIAIVGTDRKTVKLSSRDLDGSAPGQGGRNRRDRGLPGRVGTPSGSKELDVTSAPVGD